VVVANAGALTFEIRVPGRTGHGSMCQEGTSAFEAFLPLHPLTRETQSAVGGITGSTPPVAAATSGSDLRLYTGIGGIPTLLYGPGDVRHAHAPSEQVKLDEVVQCARALALLAVRRCVEPP
jgi:acetylornithine deacetylase/succinyl-diaminopimelate desuccinylase-like protein